MSRVTGGIYSKPSGKTAGIVWGAARTRTGKVATARQLVPPSNPNSPAQQTQRGKFAEALFIVRSFGASIYQEAWNRSIGQLPGFQSMQSSFLNALTADLSFYAMPSINLGLNHLPNTVSAVLTDATHLAVNWSTELSGIATSADKAQILLIPSLSAFRREPDAIVHSITALRSAGTATIVHSDLPGDYTVVVYFLGVGTADGIYSPTITLQAS
jgi:hypothetical protein